MSKSRESGEYKNRRRHTTSKHVCRKSEHLFPFIVSAVWTEKVNTPRVSTCILNEKRCNLRLQKYVYPVSNLYPGTNFLRDRLLIDYQDGVNSSLTGKFSMSGTRRIPMHFTVTPSLSGIYTLLSDHIAVLDIPDGIYISSIRSSIMLMHLYRESFVLAHAVGAFSSLQSMIIDNTCLTVRIMWR